MFSALIDSSAERWLSGVAVDSGVGDLLRAEPCGVKLSNAAETGVKAGVLLGETDPEANVLKLRYSSLLSVGLIQLKSTS